MKEQNETATFDSRAKDTLKQRNEESIYIVKYLQDMGITYSHKEIKTIISKIKAFTRDAIVSLYDIRLPYIGTFAISQYRIDKAMLYKKEKIDSNRLCMKERLKTCRKLKLKIVNEIGIDT